MNVGGSQDFRLTWVNYSQKLTESFHKFLTSEILCNVTLWVHESGVGGGTSIKVRINQLQDCYINLDKYFDCKIPHFLNYAVSWKTKIFAVSKVQKFEQFSNFMYLVCKKVEKLSSYLRGKIIDEGILIKETRQNFYFYSIIFLKQTLALSLCTRFSNFGFRSLFQTWKKIEFKTNLIFFRV